MESLAIAVITGVSFTGLTVKINVVESLKVPSEACAVIVDTPFQLAIGSRVNVDDAIETIANSVQRMRRLMGQLSDGGTHALSEDIDLDDVIKNAIGRCDEMLPQPTVSGTF